MELINKQHYMLAFLFSVALTAGLYAAAPTQEQQIILLLLFAGLIGIPHGLTDWWLLPNASKRIGFSGSVAKLRAIGVAIYLLLMACFLMFWFVFPVAGLAIFLCLSMWHFGMQDARAHGLSDVQRMIHGPLRGASLIFIIYLAHPQTSEYFNLLTQSNMFTPIVTNHNEAIWLALLYILASVSTMRWRYICESALLMTMLIMLPPLLSFTLYFCIWHTPRHYMHALQYRSNHRQQIMKIMFFSVCAIFLLGYISTVVSFEAKMQHMVVFFQLLAALTFSHVVLNRSEG